MRITPKDKLRLASAGFVVTLGVVGWGFIAGWFTPQPVRMMKLEGDPSVTILPGDDPKGGRPKAQPVKVRVRPAPKPTGGPLPPRTSAPIQLGQGEPAPPEPLFRPWEPEKPRTPLRAVAPSVETPFRPASQPLRLTPRLGSGMTAPRSTQAPPPERPVEVLRYPGEFTGHWIDDIRSQGRLLELEDGSHWEVSDMDVPTVRGWKPTQNVSLYSHGLPPYPYRISGRYGRAAAVRLVRLPAGRRKLPRDSEEVEVEQ